MDRALYTAMKHDLSLPLSVRQHAQRLFETELPRDSALVRTRRMCAVTGRSRAVLRHFRLGRHMFRRMANAGMLPGVRKACW